LINEASKLVSPRLSVGQFFSELKVILQNMNPYLSLRIKPELRRALQARADALGLKESDIVRIALTQWVTATSSQSINLAGAGDRSAAQEVQQQC
jgi:hypothetical protein